MNGTRQVKTALEENLKELHLRAMLACFEDTARRAEKETLSYEQYLRILELAAKEGEAKVDESLEECFWRKQAGATQSSRLQPCKRRWQRVEPEGKK